MIRAALSEIPDLPFDKFTQYFLHLSLEGAQNVNRVLFFHHQITLLKIFVIFFFFLNVCTSYKKGAHQK